MQNKKKVYLIISIVSFSIVLAALAAIGGSMTEHAGIMNIGMDGMILMGAFFGVYGSYLCSNGWLGCFLWGCSSACSSRSSS